MNSSNTSYGIAVSRRAASVVKVERSGRLARCISVIQCTRESGETLDTILARVLGGIPPHSGIALALSPGDLACSDVWTPPAGLQKAMTKLGPAMIEGRCLSETLETLASDVNISGASYQAISMSRESLDKILGAAKGFKLGCVTSIPAALAQLLGKVSMDMGGDHVDVTRSGDQTFWRSYPTDRPDGEESVSYQGQDIPLAHSAAFAAAVCDPEQVPNLLNVMPEFRKTFVRRFRDPIISIAAGVVLCLIALSIRFHREAIRDRQETAAALRSESELWARFLPAQEPREGQLLRAFQARIDELGEGHGAADFPSALAFWGEIGLQMPDPDALGLTLDSLDLAPDGGRLLAHVSVVKDDPLKNASQLESRLNQSARMTARGDYEVREGQVQIRIRMDYKR